MKRFVNTVLAGLALLAPGTSSAAADPAPGTVTNLPTIRIIALKGAYADHPTRPGFDAASLLSGDFDKPASFVAICDKVDELATNPSISHVFFDLSAPDFRMNQAQLAELGRHIQGLRLAKKTTFAWLENAGTPHYIVACACDTILLADLGSLDLPSLALTTFHFHDAMELLGVKASVVRVGEFKGAVEPFTMSEMSDGLRQHYHSMIESMNDSVVAQIAAARGLPKERVRALQGDRLFAASAAERTHLVDALVPFGGERAAVEARLGGPVKWIAPPKPQLKPLGFFELFAKIMGGIPDEKTAEPSIAVLHLDGTIVDGKTEKPGSMVAGPTVKEIQSLTTDTNIAGVVVRINSPGGSVTASEAIRRALEELAAKKPLVISMGELAASGGYWISCLGKPIYAELGTLTGSIGVFGMKLSLGGLLKKAGLKMQTVALDDSAGAMQLDREWTTGERAKLQNFVDEIYEQFLKRVGESRHLTRAKLPALAEGRVWSGAQAKELGLVDQLGGLDLAIAAVTLQAGLKPGCEILHRPQPRNIFETFDPFGETTQQIETHLPGPVRSWMEKAGFDWRTPLAILDATMQGSAAQVWLLAPTQFRIQ